MKLSGALPKGESDGLSSLEGKIVKNKKSPVIVFAILDPRKIESDVETGEQEVKLGIHRIEAVLPDDIEAATQLIRRAYESRTGDTTLPIELENDLKSALKGVSLYEPETARPEGDEEVIEVPEGGYEAMTLKLLTALLKKRGLDSTRGTKTELIERLVAGDDAGPTPPPAKNVTSLFSNPDEPVETPRQGNTDAEFEEAAPGRLEEAEEISGDDVIVDPPVGGWPTEGDDER